jgi:hypothetical protein
MTTDKTETEPPIEFEWYVTGPNGARFTLYPETSVHTEDDVKRAKQWLHNNRDVVSLQIRWKRAGDTRENPMKIPDAAIISHLKEEAGKREAYILELEEKLKTKEEVELKFTAAEKAEFRKTQIYQFQKKQIHALNTEINKLRKDKNDLIVKLVQNKNKD